MRIFRNIEPVVSRMRVATISTLSSCDFPHISVYVEARRIGCDVVTPLESWDLHVWLGLSESYILAAECYSNELWWWWWYQQNMSHLISTSVRSLPKHKIGKSARNSGFPPPSTIPPSVQSIFSQIFRLTQGRQDAHRQSITSTPQCVKFCTWFIFLQKRLTNQLLFR